jgi:hypothetical protein
MMILETVIYLLGFVVSFFMVSALVLRLLVSLAGNIVVWTNRLGAIVTIVVVVFLLSCSCQSFGWL